MTKPKVKLTGRDGNAFAIIARVQKALKQNGQEEEAKKFIKEATSGDYNHLIQTAMRYVEVS